MNECKVPETVITMAQYNLMGEDQGLKQRDTVTESANKWIRVFQKYGTLTAIPIDNLM